MRVLKALVLVIFSLFLFLPALWAQSQTQSPPQEKPKEPDEEGIPITNPLVVEKCSSCHKKDEKGRLTRISYERLTPEGWQMAIKRMVRLNGLNITPEEARAIVKYLSNFHGLAPEEAKPAMYQAEHRMIDENVPDESVRTACIICHSYGRIISQRRTREEWELLINMHVGYFPVVEFQGFRRFPPPPDAPPPPPGTDTRHPADRAVEFLAKTLPLQSPEWSAWRANLRAPKMAGRWLVTGYQIGRGRIYGEVSIEPAAVEDEFTTKIKLHYVKDGTVVTRTGRSIVYTGYSWRGRSFSDKGRQAGSNNNDVMTNSDPGELREVMFISRDWLQMEGRWFWGDYEEFGIDVTLRRIGADPIVLGLDRLSIKAPATGEQLRIFGSNFPSDLKVEDFDFGPGITVKRIINAGNENILVEVDVAEGAVLGKRDIAVRHSFASGAITVYDKVDYIKVSPDKALARLGGVKFPKGYQQFEALAYNRGPDNKPQTADDLNLGPIDVEWSVEEFPSTYNDDDKEFVGTLSRTGLFTPAIEGPNPKRKFERNNYGEIWVIATYKSPGATRDGAKDSRPFTARSYLVVTIPLYVKWDQPEVAR
ncbi:MAG: quinohemoprotein amine dehydrogenase subunit alpha [Acidobacteria bacterium]|nr:quinohemoprotein amine dehydrogenase subunit alpha [Acidobacteriota bacterium]